MDIICTLFVGFGGLEKGRLVVVNCSGSNLLGAGVLGHSLGALRHGVLGKLTREHEAHGGLDLAGREGGLLVVGGKLARLAGDALEDVVDERVHDGHAARADARVGVDLLEHLVDVRAEGLDALALALLVALGLRLGGGLGGFGFRWHVVVWMG